MTLRDYLNLDGSDDIHVLLKSHRKGKVTPQMVYTNFVKHALEVVNPVMRKYVDEQKPKMEACKTVEQLTALIIPVINDELKELIVATVEKQKMLDIVEQTFLFLDLWRAVTGRIGEHITRMGMHYANALKKSSTHIIHNKGGSKILRSDGSSY